MIISYKMPGRLKISRIFQGSRESILKGLLTNKYASLRFLKAACVIILDSFMFVAFNSFLPDATKELGNI